MNIDISAPNRECIMIEVKPMSMDSSDAKMLIGELNEILTSITGDDGTVHFHPQDVEQSRSVFLIAYIDGVPMGCGALREINNLEGEIKRIYARTNTCKIGQSIMQVLEQYALNFGYRTLYLETRIQNARAIRFYQRISYVHCENYGTYKNSKNSYCFRKSIE